MPEKTPPDTSIASDHPLLADLTEAQRQAVVCTEGPLLVLAAAGSGKTRVITRRIAWLIQEIGIAPWNVLAITFTNKAADEMRQRVGQWLSPRQARAATICTFHALCARLLRQYGHHLDLPPHYTIYDSADQKRLLRLAMDQLNISAKNFAPQAILNAISNAKNRLVDEQAYAADAGDFFSRIVARLFTRYQQLLRANQAVDFDDLLVLMARLLRKHPDVRAELQDRFQYLLIDEYQDTNHAQFVIADQLAAAHRNICVVGDPDQSIYGWRGATLQNILDFEKHFPHARVIELGENFRSTPQILKAADTLIRHNAYRKPKALYTSRPPEQPIFCYLAHDAEHEAQLVRDWLTQHHRQGLDWSQMAVFYRINAMSRVLEDILRDAAIPYQLVRGTAFYQRAEIKDALAYLAVLFNPDDSLSLLRIINMPPRGLGKVSIERLQQLAAAHHLSLPAALEHPARLAMLSPAAARATARLAGLFHQWRHRLLQPDPALTFQPGVRDVVEMVIKESGLEKLYQQGKHQDEDRLANLYELISAAHKFDEQYDQPDRNLLERLGDYLAQVALVSDADALNSQDGKVSLMTLHAAKGLEFDAVAIIGLEQGLLPHSRALDDPAEMEEERRLCFVGITRARKHLLLTHAQLRQVQGRLHYAVPSCFLQELPDQVMVVQNHATHLSGDQHLPSRQAPPHTAIPDRLPQSSTRHTPAPPSAGGHSLCQGTIVRHRHFGQGTVLAVHGRGPAARARVLFQKAGLKTLVLEHARLEIVN